MHLVTYKNIPGFLGYRVGDDGSVWSCRRTGGGAPMVIGGSRGDRIGTRWRLLKPIRRGRNKGYVQVTIRSNGLAVIRLVHQLVLEIFVGPPPSGMMCCHRDGNGRNNALTNLRWGTSLSNAKETIAHGRTNKGCKNPHVKLTTAQVIELRMRVRSGERIDRLAKEFSITRGTVGSVVYGRSWGWLAPETILKSTRGV